MPLSVNSLFYVLRYFSIYNLCSFSQHIKYKVYHSIYKET